MARQQRTAIFQGGDASDHNFNPGIIKGAATGPPACRRGATSIAGLRSCRAGRSADCQAEIVA